MNQSSVLNSRLKGAIAFLASSITTSPVIPFSPYFFWSSALKTYPIRILPSSMGHHRTSPCDSDCTELRVRGDGMLVSTRASIRIHLLALRSPMKGMLWDNDGRAKVYQQGSWSTQSLFM